MPLKPLSKRLLQKLRLLQSVGRRSDLEIPFEFHRDGKLSATILANSGFWTLPRVASSGGGSPFVLLSGDVTEVGISSHLCLGLCAFRGTSHKIDHALREALGALA